MTNIVVSLEQGRVPVTVFRLDGDLNNEEPLQSQAREAYQMGMQHLLLDLTDVPFISSAGLKALHQVYMMLRDPAAENDRDVRQGIVAGTYKSPNFKLLKPSKNAAKALSVSGYDMFLEIHNNLSEAVASF
jgi:hypothetical protein